MEKIKSNYYGLLLLFLFRTFFLGICLNNLLLIANKNSIISIMFSFILGIVPLLFFYLILNHDQNLNINQLINKYFNKYIAFVLKVTLILTTIFFIIILLFVLNDFITTQYIYKSSPYIISFLFIIPILNLATKRLTVLIRCAIIFFILSMILYIFSSMFLTSKLDLNNFLPILENGLKPVFKSALICTTFNFTPIFTLLIIPKSKIENNKKIFKKIFFSYFIVYIIFTLTTFFIIAVLGIDLAIFYEYPEFHVLKLITISNFIQRIESILSFQWFLDIIVILSFFMYYIKISIKQTFKITEKLSKNILFVLAPIIILISNNIFPDNTYAYNFFNNQFIYISIITAFIIPIIIIIKIKKKPKNSFCKKS